MEKLSSGRDSALPGTFCIVGTVGSEESLKHFIQN